MPHRLVSDAPDFEARFSAILSARQGADADVGVAARAIITEVRSRGDEALIDLTRRFDRLNMRTAADLRITPERLRAAAAECPAEVRQALELAAQRIRTFHEHQRPTNLQLEQEDGMRLGYRFTAVDAVGLYVPGGTAAYPSSLLMNAIPAQVAGVGRIVVTVPTPDDALSPALAAAFELLGLDEIYRVGGAQAVAALAYGTDSIKAVDVIVGPGNAYVAAAKREVYGQVGIDSLAGPSEILVIADDSANPEWLAADLLSQAEHDTEAQAILLTDSEALADQVAEAVERQLAALPRGGIAAESWNKHGAIVLLSSLDEAPALANRIAAEHVEIICREHEPVVAGIRHAGAIFIGAYSSEPIGDYLAGTNHVLPTAGSARFSSGLGVMNFMKRTSLIHCSPAAFAGLAQPTIALAMAEGLEAHAQAIRVRRDGTGRN
jgi:histidinol dehydrogenase